MKEEFDNSSVENYLIILAESDNKEEEKEGTVEKDFHILKFDKEENELIEDLQEELYDTIFSKRVWDSDQHIFLIRYQRK